MADIPADHPAAPLLTPPDEEHARLLTTIFRPFTERERWPTFAYVEQVLDTLDPPLDATSLIASLPSVGSFNHVGVYRAVWVEQRGGAIMPDSRIGLTILGRHLVVGGADTGVYIRVMRILGEMYRTSTPDPDDASFPAISWSLLRTAREIPHWLKKAGNDLHLRSVLEHEPPTFGSAIISGPDGDWNIHLTRRLRGLYQVESAADYVKAVAEMLAVSTPEPLRALPSPFSLPSALDYFDVVWRLHTGERSLILLPGAERTAALAQPAATYEEFGSRLDAIGETLKTLQVPKTPGVDGHGVVRLKAWLGDHLDDDEQPGADEALSVLMAVADLRNAIRHPTPKVAMPDACRALGITWPIFDYGGAWAIVQDKCVDALSELRDAIRTLAPAS